MSATPPIFEFSVSIEGNPSGGFVATVERREDGKITFSQVHRIGCAAGVRAYLAGIYRGALAAVAS